jgi:hypothetical protein
MSARRPPSLGEYIAHEARHAIHDIRQKVFEEAWFGRAVTAEPVMEIAKDRDDDKSRQPSFDELWGRSPGGKEQPVLDRDPGEIELDR